ncbi:MAG: hypothetical protein IKU44_02710 [Firmicutes bacterium]|nr:hypothetical protein [Bacillota bacterium]
MSTTTNTKKEKNVYVQMVARDMGVPYQEALDKMKKIKSEYQITYSEFARNHLFDFSGEILEQKAENIVSEKKKKEQFAISKVMEATGWTKEHATEEARRVHDIFQISTRMYWLRQLYAKSDSEIRAYKDQTTQEKAQRMEKIKAESGWTMDQIKSHMAHCKVHFDISSVEYYCNFRCWELSDDQLTTFAVDEDSRKLSRKYNVDPTILSNKQKFNTTFQPFLGRKYWVNKGSSFASFLEFASGIDKAFCKPLSLSMGVGTKIIEIPKDEEALFQLYQKFSQDIEILLEECIPQHPVMSQVYDGSVNTVRFTMLRNGDQIHRLWSFVRFGRNGIIDNFHGGGLAAAVDVNTGIILSDAMDSQGEFYKEHPTSKIPFKGFQIPYWDQVLEITEKAMASQDAINYVGWDVAICPDKVVLVEGNSTPQVGVYQSILAPTKEGQKKVYEKFL